MFFLKLHKLHTIFLSILTLVTLILWWPTRMLPYWWDSAGYVMRAAKFYLDTNFSSFILPSDAAFSVMAHPPLFPWLLALAWKLFGMSVLVSHLFYLPFVLLAVWGTYALAMRIASFEDGTMNHFVGFAAGLLLLACPLFLAQVGIIYMEIPTAAFAVWAAYFFLQKNVRAHFAAATLMILMKEVAAVIIAAILCMIAIRHAGEWWGARDKFFYRSRHALQDLALYASPILVLAAWFVWHKLATDWWFALPYYQETFAKEVVGISWPKIQQVLGYFFMEQLRWMMTLGAGLAAFIIFARWEIGMALNRAQWEGLALCFSISIVVPVLFGKLEFLPRYIVFGLPFLFILFAVLWGHVLRFRVGSDASVRASRKIVFTFLICMIAFFFTGQWNPKRAVNSFIFPPLEENLEYIDVMIAGKQTVQFVEAHYADSIIYTGFPSDYMLSQPFQGYATKDLAVRNCNDYQPGDDVDIIVFHLLSPAQVRCRKMIDSLGFVALNDGGFAQNGKWMQVFAPPTAKEAAPDTLPNK